MECRLGEERHMSPTQVYAYTVRLQGETLMYGV